MNRLCPICFSSRKNFIYKQNFNNRDISLMDNYDVVTCVECGFVYADNIPSQADFDNYYAVMSKYEFNYKDGVAPGDYIDYYTKIADFLIPRINKNTRVLDIGCSTGGLLSVFKLKGYLNLLGIDPSPSCVKTTREFYGINASINSISNFQSNEKFDLIILSAVLEHLADFSGSMRKITSVLSENGLLFIEVPDAERFSSYISAPFQQFSIEHINYFSKYSVKNLLTKFLFKEIGVRQDENKLNLVIDPDLFVLSQKTNDKNSGIIKDVISGPGINDYVRKCLDMDIKIKKTLQDKLLNKNKIIVWGVGTHTQRLIGSGLDISRVLYFVDSNIRYLGKRLKGIEIKSPRDIQEDNPILISTCSYQKEIAYQIEKVLKLNNEVIKIY